MSAALPAVPAGGGALRAPASPARPAQPRSSRPPYAPDASHIIRFWLAGPLTLILFVPALFAGVFGAPLMIPGYFFAWRMLRGGHDSYDDFALAGFGVGVAALLVAAAFGGGLLFAFGLLFGPLMAMTFRAIAGTWRPAPPAA